MELINFYKIVYFVQAPRCECNPGWTGANCNTETMPSTFNSQSYVKYALSFEPDRFTTDIQLRYALQKIDL